MKQQFPNYGVKEGLTSKIWWKKFIKEVFNGAGCVELCNRDAKRLEQLSEYLYDQFGLSSSWEVTDGVREMLKDLKKMGLKTAVVSNFDERLPIVLDQLKLLNLFDYLITSVAAEAEKPSTRIFEYAVKVIGIEPEKGLHVGDNYEEDVIPARLVGMQALLFDEQSKSTDALHHFNCLVSLLK